MSEHDVPSDQPSDQPSDLPTDLPSDGPGDTGGDGPAEAGSDAATNGGRGAKRFLPIVLVVIGVAVLVIGTLGVVNDWGASDSKTPDATKDVPTTVDLGPARTETSSVATTTPTTGTPTTDIGAVAPTAVATTETPQEFLTLLADGLSVGGNPFMLSRLHPAVIERYGE